MFTFTQEINKEIFTEVVVVGGGLAGAAAAIASARSGSKVILLEQSGCLGGQAGWGIVTPLSSTHSRDGKPFGGLISEICDSVRELAKRYCIPEGKEGSTIAAPHILKYVLLKMCDDAGVELHFHTSLIGAQTSDGQVKNIIISEKSGLASISAKYFIDASGDGDLIYYCHDRYSLGSEPGVLESLSQSGLDKVHYSDQNKKYDGYGTEKVMQPVSIFFTMGGVDYKQAEWFNNKNLTYSDLGISFDDFSALPYAGECGFEQGGTQKLPLPQGRILVSRGVRNDIAVINMSRIVGIDASDADSLNRGELLAQKQVLNLVDFLKRFVPGFENSYYIESASSLGIRESRRLVGRYVLTGSDVINCRTFDDAIARGSYIIDIHDPKGKSKAVGGEIKGSYYEIPYRSLISANYSNLMAVGRCISADHVAHSSTRIQGTCILTGQAAGIAAAIAVRSDCPVGSVDIITLRDALNESGVWLEK